MTQPAADLATLSDLCTPWCVHVAATLRIAEYLVGSAPSRRFANSPVRLGWS